jgi:hypothetical protein
MRCTLILVALALFAALLAGCGGGGSSTPPPYTPTTPTATLAAVPDADVAGTLTADANTAITFTVPKGAVAQACTVTITRVSPDLLPAPLRARGRFTLHPDNTCVVAFTIAVAPATAFTLPLRLAGTARGTTADVTLNLATLAGGTWTDIGAVNVGADGALVPTLPSPAHPGITGPGTYVLYRPGTPIQIASNLGMVLVADDGYGEGDAYCALQAIRVLDRATGAPLATPTISYLQFPGRSDIDGSALTPDGRYGLMIDGSSCDVLFFRMDPITGICTAGAAPLNVSSYSNDGDAVAILSGGDEAVVCGDSPVLPVLSGIAAGNPQLAHTLTCPGNRQGLVISADDRTLLARGDTEVTVFSVTGVSEWIGDLGATLRHDYMQTANLTDLGYPGMEDGRNGMAISPTDSSRALVLGDDAVTLLTGLPFQPVKHRLAVRFPTTRPRAVRERTRTLSLGAGNYGYCISISPDGTLAVIGTEAGLILLAGVNTGMPAQVGGIYNPAVTIGGAPTTLGRVTTLGITMDGKYVVAMSQSCKALFTIPLSAAGFGAPVGKLEGVAVTDNDQLMIH